jgi:hypothetical protein
VKSGRLLIPLVIAFAVLAGGCVSSTSSSSTPTTAPRQTRSPSYATLCTDIGTGTQPTSLASKVVKLVVIRLPEAATGFRFPRVVVSRDDSRIRQIAKTLCSLRRLNDAGKFVACPADVGISYVLQFSTATERLAPVRIDATGCESVTGIGGSRWLLSSPGFWPLLGAAMGLTPSEQDWNGPSN